MVANADFSDANLSGADFSDTDFSMVDLSVVRDVEWCRWDETTVWPAGFSPPEDLDGEEPDDLEDGQ